MEVELTTALIDHSATSDLELLALSAFGFSGRHRVLPDDLEAWTHWRRRLPDQLADEVDLAWQESDRRDEHGTRSERLRVVPKNPSGFGATPIELTPAEALGLLGRPLRVLLENGRNDRAFLLAFAGSSREYLERAEREGWLVFETAGGIGELKVRSQAAVNDAPREVYRTMYVCDSDARQPGAPASDPAKVASALHALGAKYKRNNAHFGVMLARREAENYAPPAHVIKWAESADPRNAHLVHQEYERDGEHVKPGEAGQPRRKLLAALALRQLVPDLRECIDMKEGQAGTDPAVWGKLDAFQQSALLDGFGKTFGPEFYAVPWSPPLMSGEITSILMTILERL